MSKIYNKYGVTTGGYRGERAILKERVVEGLEEVSFSDQLLQLDASTPQTIYLNSNNMAEGNYIVLPKASDLWPNWQVAIINESAFNCPIYYYTDDYTQLNLFKEATGGNMVTCILLDDTTVEGTWTTLRTVEQSSVDLLNRYTSNVFEEVEILFGELQQDATTIVRRLGNVLNGTSVKSVYIKTQEAFAGDGEHPVTLSLTIGKGGTYTAGYDYTQDAEYDADYFTQSYDLTTAVADGNFTKDLFDEILSTSADKQVLATFTGTNLQYLTAGAVKIVVEKAKLIDPTVLKNPIVQTQVPIGVIMNYGFPDIPEGYWRLDGTVFPNAADSIPQFVKKLITMNNQQPSTAKLIVGEDEWQQIKNQYGSCSKFAWVGSGLRFPEINCFVQGLNSINQLATMMEAGLPNITGQLNAYGFNNGWSIINGCFESDGVAYPRADFQGGNGTGVRLDASKSNSTFGKSNTVQPTSARYPYIISIYNKIQNSSVLDLEEILESSVYKLNTNLNNIDADGIDTLKSITNNFNYAGIPNYDSVLTYSNNIDYTLDYSIWLFINTQLYNARGYIWINDVQYELGGYDDNDAHGSSCVFYIPAGTKFNCNIGTMRGWPLI